MTGQGAIMKIPSAPAEHRYKALVCTHENDVWPESMTFQLWCNWFRDQTQL
ncbi:MAG: hypothetical protein K9N51_08075 [Candidatus Pacebacteria bacterium]|nr:hypothetical protein [Candidatus Paceibacterota bacterium]